MVKDLPTFNSSLARLSVLFSSIALKVATNHFAANDNLESIQAMLGCVYFFLALKFEMNSCNSYFVADQKRSSRNFASFNYSPKSCFFLRSTGYDNWLSACGQGNCCGPEVRGLFSCLTHIFRAHLSDQTHLTMGKRRASRKCFFLI